MTALPDISWFLGARQPTGMSDCHENGSPPPKEEGEGGGGRTINHPWPLLIKEGSYNTTELGRYTARQRPSSAEERIGDGCTSKRSGDLPSRLARTVDE